MFVRLILEMITFPTDLMIISLSSARGKERGIANMNVYMCVNRIN